MFEYSAPSPLQHPAGSAKSYLSLNRRSTAVRGFDSNPSEQKPSALKVTFHHSRTSAVIIDLEYAKTRETWLTETDTGESEALNTSSRRKAKEDSDELYTPYSKKTRRKGKDTSRSFHVVETNAPEAGPSRNLSSAGSTIRKCHTLYKSSQMLDCAVTEKKAVLPTPVNPGNHSENAEGGSSKPLLKEEPFQCVDMPATNGGKSTVGSPAAAQPSASFSTGEGTVQMPSRLVLPICSYDFLISMMQGVIFFQLFQDSNTSTSSLPVVQSRQTTTSLHG